MFTTLKIASFSLKLWLITTGAPKSLQAEEMGDDNVLREEAIEEFRRRLAPTSYLDKEKLQSNSFLFRYLKYHRMDMCKAEKTIRNYFHYADKKKATLEVKAPPEYKKLYQVFGGARDYYNRPVVQVPNIKDWNLTRHISKNEELLIKTLVKKMHWFLERQLLESESDFAVMILDLKDVEYTFSLCRRVFNLGMEIAQELNSVAPGVFGECIILNAPRVVTTLVSAALAILRRPSPGRPSRCHMMSTDDSNWKERITEIIPEDQLRPEFGGTFTGYQILD